MSKTFNFNQLYSGSLPSPCDLKKEFPATSKHLNFVHDSCIQIQRILDGKDPRLLLIIGPCSIHDTTAAKEYALKLKELATQVSRYFFVLMRTYFEKPRTALGWKGMLHDPHLDGSYDISTGLRTTRDLLLFLADIGVPTATEFLDPSTPQYISDLITWACIGARTSESPVHRQLASGLTMPVAFKNSTSGNIEVAINGILAASSPHTFLGINDNGHLDVMKTEGNPYAHMALRGGENKPNYDPQSISHTLENLKKFQLPSRLIVDCSHDNSCRRHMEQFIVFESVIQQHIQGNSSIRGLAMESHLYAGNQPLSANKSSLEYGVSITDPCLDWNSTKDLILWGKAMLEKEKNFLDQPIETLEFGYN